MMMMMTSNKGAFAFHKVEYTFDYPANSVRWVVFHRVERRHYSDEVGQFTIFWCKISSGYCTPKIIIFRRVREGRFLSVCVCVCARARVCVCVKYCWNINCNSTDLPAYSGRWLQCYSDDDDFIDLSVRITFRPPWFPTNNIQHAIQNISYSLMCHSVFYCSGTSNQDKYSKENVNNKSIVRKRKVFSWRRNELMDDAEKTLSDSAF